VGLKERLAATAADAARAGVEKAKEKIDNESVTSRLTTLRDMQDDRSTTIEALLVLLIDAVREENCRELSERDIKKFGKRRQRIAGGLGMFAGPAGIYIASLYSEVKIFCDVAERHRVALPDEDLAAHLLVIWNAMPNFESARAAVDGSGQSVASRLAAISRDKVIDKPLGEMTKKDAAAALWRLRGVTDSSLPGSARARDVLLPGGRVKAVMQAAECQLGVAAHATSTAGRPYPHPDGDAGEPLSGDHIS